MRCITMITLACTLLALLASCGKYPPIVKSKRDISKLHPREPSVRARGLSDADISSLKHLINLDHLDFAGGWKIEKAKISDAGLKALSQLSFTRLETLTLGYCDRITDSGLSHLTGMKTVKRLSLAANPNITDQGLNNLAAMATLTGLDLRGCSRITDSGLANLTQMKGLQRILLGGCPKISSKGVQMLQKALPNCHVKKDDKLWAYEQK